MRGHAECDNLVLLAICLELGGVVAFMPVKDQETIGII
jgi:hypothetical protein